LISPRRAAGRSLLLAVGSAAGGALAFAGALLFLSHALLGSVIPANSAGLEDRLQSGMLGFSLLLVGVLSVVAAYQGVQWLRGAGQSEFALRPGRAWQFLALLAIWIGSVWGAQLAVRLPAWKWLAVLLHAVAIALPIYVLLLLATAGLERGSLQRVWGAFSAGMWLSTGLALVAEALLGVLALIAVGVYLAAHPEQAAFLQRLIRDLGSSRGLPEAFTALQPLLDQPIALFLALLAFSGLAPIIEETAKSVTTWLVIDLLRSPAAGFVTGALGGAGFALLEGLFASANPDMYWGTTLLVRAGSSMMHISAAAVAGYGISAFYASRRPVALASGYLGAMTLHSLWNASIIFLAFGGIRLSAPGLPQAGLVGWLMVVIGASILAALCLGTPIALSTLNHRLRPAPADLSSQQAPVGATDDSGAQSAADVRK
jgi:RsiW-degrading membrane proteinase PrsW (M82 family)